MKDPRSCVDGACAGGAGSGIAAPKTACVAPEDSDISFGTGTKTTLGTGALAFGFGYSLNPGGQSVSQIAQAGGYTQGFYQGPSDVFTEGEGLAGHPAKWGYKRLPVCKNTADLQKFGANGMTPNLATLLKDPKIEILILIIFLWVVLK